MVPLFYGLSKLRLSVTASPVGKALTPFTAMVQICLLYVSHQNAFAPLMRLRRQLGFIFVAAKAARGPESSTPILSVSSFETTTPA
jgi:hypothetical protein